MAATIANGPSTPGRHPFDHAQNDVFSSNGDFDSFAPSYQHRFSSRFDVDPLDLNNTSSPSQVKRTIEAHLQETDRRLLDTQKLGTSLLKQREDLTSRLEEVEQYQDEAQIPGDLRKRLADIEREHADVGREVARALIGPKSKQDDLQPNDPGVFTSQATGSPTKISAPSRRQRNQPSTRAGDLQFAADISTSLLAQVRQLQAAVAERDDTIKRFNAERDSADRDLQAYTQKIRALDESEQKYKDENWSLETQKHDLLNAARDAQDKEKRLIANLAAALAEKNRLHSDLEEINMAHSKLVEEHGAIKKAHDTEIHGLKRNADIADSDRQSLQDKIDELIAQNQELAKAIATRSRSRQANIEDESRDIHVENIESLDTPEDSPPASPTKATPRHGALESETLRSSLHHAHRMIQNLKGNIHREKTEKIELKRMLQEARDDLEQRRGSDNGSAAKRQKIKSEVFKKPARPDMLGGTRRSRTDIEMADDDWEDHQGESPAHSRPNAILSAPRGHVERMTDLSDAYQTANETESFDTADERNTTESEAFMTGAESLAGDSTDELTETEDTTSRTGRVAPGRVGRASLLSRPVGDRASYLSTASTSGDEADDTQTPVQPSFSKFKLRNNRSSYKPNVLVQQSTPESFRSRTISQDSPATVMTEQSPAGGEQSLFAELGGMDEINSETQSLQSTPARSSALSSQHSTPGVMYTPSKSANIPQSVLKPVMVDSSTMTEAWAPESTITPAPVVAHAVDTNRDSMLVSPGPAKVLLPSAFPLPPSVPTSPVRKTDTSTQYTPQRGSAESPIRPGSSYITPPKMVWDQEHEGTPANEDLEHMEHTNRDDPAQSLDFSGVLSQDSPPLEPSENSRAALLLDLENSRNELRLLGASLDQHQSHMRMLEDGHSKELTTLNARISDYNQELSNLRNALAASESEKLDDRVEIENLRAALTRYEERLALLSATSYSPILSQEIHPVSTPQIEVPALAAGLSLTGLASQDAPRTPERPRTAEKVANSKLISAATTLDSPESQRVESPLMHRSEMREPASIPREMVDSATSPLRDIPSLAESPMHKDRTIFAPETVKHTTSHDEGSQTMLTAQQIEEALQPKKSTVAPIPVPMHPRSPSARSPTRYPGRPSSRSRDVLPISEDSTAAMPTSPTRRPGSSSSNRASSLVSQNYPPLPSDHRDIIAKANTQLESPSKRESTQLRTGGIMGPPIMPASAMRRPRTPNESVRAATPASTGTARKRGTVGSHVSRRSSVSSFASELDERFNIRPDQQAAAHGFQASPGTDPRMIQAITQTMIGEFLWKYTRKTGSKEMSSTRHRRYFWVHPYTKTLYWSEQDPQTAGRSENKAKSVAIESVRVVSDENPMPPGLHRKSLEVTTPGRVVKFTASTGQRHETWFNALSYLLHRGDEHENGGGYVSDNNDITQADINEFSVNGYGARLVPNDSRMSMSSYNSRTTRGTASNRVSQAGRSSVPIGTISTSQTGPSHGQAAAIDTIRRTRQDQAADKDRTIRAGSVSRLTRMLGSVTSRGKLNDTVAAPHGSSQTRVNAGDVNSIYDASVVSDGRREEEEEARRQRERESNPGLEDVRACCDGKHEDAAFGDI